MKLYQEMGDKHLVAWVRACSGYVSLHQKRWQEAQTRFAESLSLYQESREKRDIAECVAGCLTGLAGVSEGQQGNESS